ncbi:hypothetical protein LRS05_16865 [Flavobacterium sp. J372]|uniref:hypothetical protein n=1 Tax=Flavobacterium sp. J372 TaxID=2898436 RepID=UPI00215152FF|nr:hypothetical protein [Flavobacterium sp. J372]MCR5862542.1 hypothetical protein [Flavobacterium sp. J372]MCR5863662.1 hypothetical protein [Flavobacterium sp. J372]
MKNVLYTFLMFTGVCGFAQDISPNLSTALKENSFSVQVSLPSANLSYYSTNYFKIFGREQYTFDTMAFKSREIYVSSDDRFYSNGTQNIPNALPDPIWNYYDNQCNRGDAAVGAAMAGIGTFVLIRNLVDGTKDYSPKIDRAAFEAAGRGE